MSITITHSMATQARNSNAQIFSIELRKLAEIVRKKKKAKGKYNINIKKGSQYRNIIDNDSRLTWWLPYFDRWPRTICRPLP